MHDTKRVKERKSKQFSHPLNRAVANIIPNGSPPFQCYADSLIAAPTDLFDYLNGLVRSQLEKNEKSGLEVAKIVRIAALLTSNLEAVVESAKKQMTAPGVANFMTPAERSHWPGNTLCQSKADLVRTEEFYMLVLTTQ